MSPADPTTPGPLLAPPDGAPERLQPPVSPAAEPFWAATRERRLVIQWCTACEQAIHFPREACPRCLGTELEFRPAAGTGVVYALSVMPGPGNPGMAGRAPFAVALVDLPEGVRMLTNVLGAGAATAGVGDEVSVAWEPLADGRHLPVFVRT
ncbi:Zn-ribbon domain-containing OB-fold protein [Aquihabitans sp. McL0605]|uniref:Zn-ribbon domain-containing OB-fold protein n=1 Tax=Aquihabitans sp. McL0605 TaxID=3415671 RepID=UPI003CF59C6B